MILRRFKRQMALEALNHIYNALCAEDMDGSFRASYILHELETLYFVLDKKSKKGKAYADRQKRLRNSH